MILIERPFALFGILAIVPAIIIVIVRAASVSKSVGVAASHAISSFKKALFVRTFFRSLAWIMLVLSYAGISWGTYRVPVQKNGNAVSLVFDISYSMNADDCAGGMTRLQAAASYAKLLLEKLDGAAVSVVLAKGDGIIAVPLTEDVASVLSVLQVLSPTLMTATGTSLGGGVMAALRSFPVSSSQASHIWLFTDGDETDGTLSSALDECAKQGVSVAVVGFGRTSEVQVISGDGKTPVMTALRSSQMNMLVQKKGERIIYVEAAENGSAIKLLEMLLFDSKNEYGRGTPVVYETQTMPRYKLFLTLAIVFFAAGFVVNDLFFLHKSRKPQKTANRKSLLALLCSVCFLLMSCGTKFDGAKSILYGTWNYYQRDYQESVGHFLHAASNEDSGEVAKQYALYGLATTYMAEQEHEAAAIRLSQIAPDAPKPVRYAAHFASGVIAFQGGDYVAAAEFFRDALKVDASKIDAKINLEMAIKNLEAHDARVREQELLPVSQRDGSKEEMERAIFERIRENDIQRWKNSEQTDSLTDELDY